MGMAEDAYADMMYEYYHWSEDVEDYIAGKSDHDLIYEVTKDLGRREDMPEKDAETIQSICRNGILRGRLSDKQRFALGSFLVG